MKNLFKSIVFSLTSLAAFGSSSAWAAQAPPLVSPELLPDGGVAFRFKAPKAAEVKVAGQFGPDAKMTKDNEGVWSVPMILVMPDAHALPPGSITLPR